MNPPAASIAATDRSKRQMATSQALERARRSPRAIQTARVQRTWRAKNTRAKRASKSAAYRASSANPPARAAPIGFDSQTAARPASARRHQETAQIAPCRTSIPPTEKTARPEQELKRRNCSGPPVPRRYHSPNSRSRILSSPLGSTGNPLPHPRNRRSRRIRSRATQPSPNRPRTRKPTPADRQRQLPGSTRRSTATAKSAHENP